VGVISDDFLVIVLSFLMLFSDTVRLLQLALPLFVLFFTSFAISFSTVSCFALSLLFLPPSTVGLYSSPHPDRSLHPEHHDTQNTSCKRSRLRAPALHNRSRKLLVAPPQQTSFTYRRPTNGSSNDSVFGATVAHGAGTHSVYNSACYTNVE